MLELAVHAKVDLETAVKIALSSMISTAHANLSVGPPYDLGVYRNGSLEVEEPRIEATRRTSRRSETIWMEHFLDAIHRCHRSRPAEPPGAQLGAVPPEPVGGTEYGARRAGRKVSRRRSRSSPGGCSGCSTPAATRRSPRCAPTARPHLGHRVRVHGRRSALRLDDRRRKGADLERDPRFALHGPTFHPEEGKEGDWPGEAKIAGRAVPPARGHGRGGRATRRRDVRRRHHRGRRSPASTPRPPSSSSSRGRRTGASTGRAGLVPNADTAQAHRSVHLRSATGRGWRPGARIATPPHPGER